MSDYIPFSAPDARLTPSEAAALIDSLTQIRPPSSTVYRWMNKGVRGRKLTSLWVGGRVYTTRSAVEEFLRQDPVLGPRVRSPEAPRPVPPVTSGLYDRVERRRSIEAARAHLKQRVFHLLLCC
jgi:hypothetical protein